MYITGVFGNALMMLFWRKFLRHNIDFLSLEVSPHTGTTYAGYFTALDLEVEK